MFDEFKMRAEAVSAEVFRVESRAAAIDFLLGFLQREGIADQPDSWAVWAPGPFLDGCDREALSRRLPGLRFDATRETAARAKAGISQMEWAAAATGTLLQDAGAVEQRLVSSLPLIHVALVPTGGIVADMPSALAKFDPGKAAYISAITGPSRTADIERVLTIGVHGPERLIIICVDEWDERVRR